jgi:hypothetical protein
MTQNQMPTGGIEPPLFAHEAEALLFSDTVSLGCRARSTGNFLFFTFVSLVAFHVRARNRFWFYCEWEYRFVDCSPDSNAGISLNQLKMSSLILDSKWIMIMNMSTTMKSSWIDISHIRWILRFDVLHKVSVSHSQKGRLDILAVLAFQSDETESVVSNVRHSQRLPHK